MDSNRKMCPKCNTTMDFRLGVYECPQCGHTEEKQQQPQEAERRFSGPGLKKPQQWQQSGQQAFGSSSGVPGQAPPPGQIHSSGVYNPHSHAPGFTQSSSLMIEKRIVMGLQIGLGLLIFIVAFSALGMLGDSGSIVASMLAFTIAIWLIQSAVLYFVLFGNAVWAKWTCMGCHVFYLLGGLIGVVNPENHDYWWAVLLQVGIYAWFISILYRDIKEQPHY